MRWNYATTESQESPVGRIGTIFFPAVHPSLGPASASHLLLSLVLICLYGVVMAKVNKPLRAM